MSLNANNKMRSTLSSKIYKSRLNQISKICWARSVCIPSNWSKHLNLKLQKKTNSLSTWIYRKKLLMSNIKSWVNCHIPWVKGLLKWKKALVFEEFDFLRKISNRFSFFIYIFLFKVILLIWSENNNIWYLLFIAQI